MAKHYNIIIVGGGPGGMTAGIYAARASKSVLIIESAVLGGTMASTERIDNYPGFVSTSGAEIAIKMEEQLLAAGAEVEYAIIQKLDCDTKTVFLDDGRELTADNIIIATGSGSKKLGLGKEEQLTGNGISYCATCDGAFFKNKPVAIAGGTVHTTTDAIYLEPIVSKLTIVVPTDKMRGLPDHIKLLSQSPKVEILYNSRATAVSVVENGSREVVSAVTVTDTKGKEQSIEIDSLFVALGSMPNSHLVFGQVITDKVGAIVTDKKMQTSKPNIYAIGDVRADAVKQITVACSDGAIAVCSILGSVVYAKK
ncbi:MAG: FAD-dependent oxidoreductase [Clostridiales bacterium]|jgi:thioredoxin reductase (NADPH)|nr:FAD-dependent oxidoreductase [Clostridiales bacterium]